MATHLNRLKEVRFDASGVELDAVTKDHLPVRVRNLLAGTELPCSIYFPFLQQPGTLSLNKLLCEGEFYDESFQEFFSSKDINVVYIEQDREDDFINYLSSNLQSLLQSAETPPERKSQLLYDNAEGIVRKVFREHPNQSNVRMGRQLVETFAVHLATDEVTTSALFSIFSKDYYTFSHSVQVALLGMSFCRFLSWSNDDVVDFGLGALFHDIGKSSIDDRILNKPGRLTEEEFDEIRKHTLVGYQQLENAQLMSNSQLEVVLHHHEATNGSGYPEGLAGEAIHKYARVARIIDCYDALTTKRPYKDALPPAKALEIMRGEMLATFDERFLQAFIGFLGMNEKPRSHICTSPIEIQLGIQVSVQFEGKKMRFTAILVGMEPEVYLILRIPASAAVQKRLHEGMRVIGRYVHDGTAFGFRSSIIGFMLHPLQLLFLTYPKTVEIYNLRSSPRIECFLPSEIEVQGIVHQGAIVDISMGGCKYVLKQSDDSTLPLSLTDDEVKIQARLFGEQRVQHFSGKVRSLSVEGNKVLLGVQFVNIDDQTLEKLKRCVDNVLTLVT